MAHRSKIESRHHIPVLPHENKVEAWHNKMDSADHMTQRSGGTETHKGMGSGETTPRDKSPKLDNSIGNFGKVMGGKVDSGD